MKLNKVPYETGFEPVIPEYRLRCYSHLAIQMIAVGTFYPARHHFRRDLNPRSPDPKSGAIPLSYNAVAVGAFVSI